LTVYWGVACGAVDLLEPCQYVCKTA
jgi:hypothetical protein